MIINISQEFKDTYIKHFYIDYGMLLLKAIVVIYDYKGFLPEEQAHLYFTKDELSILVMQDHVTFDGKNYSYNAQSLVY